jgi:leucyl aminopeptidase
MIQEWNAIEFKAGFRPDAQEQLSVADFGSRMAWMEILGGRNRAKEALSAELKKLKKPEEGDAPKTLRISFEGKGGFTGFLHATRAGAYLRQTEFRRAFLQALTPGEEAREVQFTLKGLKDQDAAEYLNWLGALSVIARYRTPVFGKKSQDEKPLGKLTVWFESSLSKKDAEAAIEEGRLLGFANNQVRHLAELPSNILHPGTYRERAEAIAKELSKNARVKCSFIGKKELLKRGAGAFLAVVQADQHERAGIVHLQYQPAKASKKKAAIVGKGLCFDTGGYNVKTGDFMFGMKEDMTGSAVALSLFQVLVMMKVPFEVHAYLALAENLIGFDAYRPNDVVVASNGMSIEVENTDAEGRMCLSDTLAIASENRPDLILDFATLTGSVIRAIDTRRSGVYSNQPELGELARKVGEHSGERVWNFPIGEDYLEPLKSDVADIRQTATSKGADHIYAATFLSRFVEKGIAWVHVDLAAGGNRGGLGLVPTETTGFGVRFGLSLIREVLSG